MESRKRNINYWKVFIFIIAIKLIIVVYTLYSYKELSLIPNFLKTKSIDENKNELKAIKQTTTPSYIDNFEFFEKNYFKMLLDYLSKWRESLKNGTNTLKTHLELLDYTHTLLIEEQKIPKLNVTERPIPLSEQLNCANPAYSSFLTSSKRDKPSNTIDIVLVGYELLLLEIRLYELYDVVDEFIIFETNITFKQARKPFFFLTTLSRYQRFLDKITLVTPFNITRFDKSTLNVIKKIDVDQVDTPDEYKLSDLPHEKRDEQTFFKIDFNIETRARMLPIQLYNKYVREFQDDEILIHGDLDEIPDGNIINHFKQCNVQEDRYPFSASSTFYIYNFNHLFRGDFPAADPFSMKFPNLMQKRHINKFKTPRISSSSNLPRATGAHCNRFSTRFVMGLYKGVSQSDSGGIGDPFMDVINEGTIAAYERLRNLYRSGQLTGNYVPRIIKKQNLQPHETVFVPWIANANKHIYNEFF